MQAGVPQLCHHSPSSYCQQSSREVDGETEEQAGSLAGDRHQLQQLELSCFFFARAPPIPGEGGGPFCSSVCKVTQ